MNYPLRLGQGTGIELEYMVVDRDTLDVKPVTDALIHSVTGAYDSDVERGAIAWSNELVAHVIELKTSAPVGTLRGLAPHFQRNVAEINERLDALGARLMPTAMHPWMDPYRELRLWPHESSEIYATFNRIFDCRGHGWANLQSTHINLSFGDDVEFGKLHAAIRLVLPILPALAASSPARDGALTGLYDSRLEVYRHNARAVPVVSGVVVPERAFSRAEYEERILQRIYADMAPHDPEGVLRHEWANARGCIARFDRGSIEIRVLDIQECPQADLAVAGAICAVVAALCRGELCDDAEQRRWSEGDLARIFQSGVRDADQAVIDDATYLRAFGLSQARASMGELWTALIERVVARDPGYAEWRESLQLIQSRGCLARRIARRLGESPSRERMRDCYAELCHALAAGTLFHG